MYNKWHAGGEVPRKRQVAEWQPSTFWKGHLGGSQEPGGRVATNIFVFLKWPKCFIKLKTGGSKYKFISQLLIA